jgi:hypothetical protein
MRNAQQDALRALHPSAAAWEDVSPAERMSPLTPPPEARTDWPRGVGELGTEGMDPSQPLNEAPIRRGQAPMDEGNGAA